MIRSSGLAGEFNWLKDKTIGKPFIWIFLYLTLKYICYTLILKIFVDEQQYGDIVQVNPPKFDMSEDMADLTFLGDACVLWNSVVRYKAQLIYTYSGLFCIAINPYKRFPIYTLRTMELYVGKRRTECWPHIFAVAEGAYQGMQLILFTLTKLTRTAFSGKAV